MTTYGYRVVDMDTRDHIQQSARQTEKQKNWQQGETQQLAEQTSE